MKLATDTRFSLLKKANFKSEDEAVQYVKNLSETWRSGLRFDPYLRDGYIKSGHLLLHSITKNQVVWNESSPEDYLFDAVNSTNESYQKYGILP